MDFILELTILPRSSMNKLFYENTLKMKITSPPIDGEANKKVIEILSEQFSYPKSKIKLFSGIKSKKKKFLFQDLEQLDGERILQTLIFK